MKHFLCLFVIAFTNYIFCQSNTVHLEYGVILYNENSFSKDKMFSDIFLNAAKEADKLKFGLIINNQGSKFYEMETGIEMSHEMKMAKIYAKYIGEIYSLEDNILKQSEILGKNYFLKESQVTNWKILNETKKIDNYLCYKATNIYTVINPKGTFRFPVTAWFCPELNYKHGPLGFGNLPGLILELQVRNVNYHLKKIDLESNINFDTAFLEKAIILSEKELNEKLDEFNNFDKN